MIDKNLSLSDGHQIPVLGFGTWKSEKNVVGNALRTAIEVGYRHIDCAKAYGNESEIGNTLKKTFSNGKVKREEIFITSKLWNADHDPKNVAEACKDTLADLQLDYLDLYLMHWGLAFLHEPGESILDEKGVAKLESVTIQKTWEAMERLVDEGLVKSIGVSNFTTPMLIDLLNYARIKPVMNQIEIHPYNIQEELVKFCHSRSIQLTAYSPLGGADDPENRPIMDKTIIEIAKNYNKTPAQVILRWEIQRELITIPKSTNMDRIKENFDIFDFELNDDEMKKISELNKNKRYVDPLKFWGIPYFN